ncbi:MAG: hypothetical protein Ct9H90mP17_4850 [Actinomycetota bacterium]|nr:MAG: hypothetical protein Ct9H90mP17_4850 [Actinomycetota bacterium]
MNSLIDHRIPETDKANRSVFSLSIWIIHSSNKFSSAISKDPAAISPSIGIFLFENWLFTSMHEIFYSFFGVTPIGLVFQGDIGLSFWI